MPIDVTVEQHQCHFEANVGRTRKKISTFSVHHGFKPTAKIKEFNKRRRLQVNMVICCCGNKYIPGKSIMDDVIIHTN